MKNYKAVDTFLRNLTTDKTIDSHSRALFDSIPLCIEEQIASLDPYLESRIMQTEQTKAIRRGCLKLLGENEYAITSAEVWYNQ